MVTRAGSTWSKQTLESDEWEVYVLQGDEGIYIGISQDMERRLRDHKAGRVAVSARLGDPQNLTLVGSKRLGKYEDAVAKESRLKKLPKVAVIRKASEWTPE